MGGTRPFFFVAASAADPVEEVRLPGGEPLARHYNVLGKKTEFFLST
jgi:hypothetical protein